MTLSSTIAQSSMSDISSDNKKIFRHVIEAFGGAPKVFAYYDDKRVVSVDVLSCLDRPYDGTTSFGTIGLSDHPLIKNGTEFPTRVEFVGACHSEYGWFAQVLSTAALFVAKDKWFCSPGTVFETLIEMYDDSLNMKHIAFQQPFLWPSLRTTQFGVKTVTWLLAVPISHSEAEYAKREGWKRLETVFEEHQIDIFDLDRPSVI